MNTNELPLNPRLKKIADLVPENACTADIGTDHAYIPIVLVQRGIAKKAIASDIKKGPLARAEANVRKNGLSNSIECRLGPGLHTLSAGDAQVIIIAGMGGILIADILEASRDVTDSAELLILQPMTAAPELRAYLAENGYTVLDEYLEAEDEKLYNIITAKPSGSTTYSTAELYLGKGLQKTSPELFRRYQDAVLKKLHRRADGLRKSVTHESRTALEEIENLIKNINDEVNSL